MCGSYKVKCISSCKSQSQEIWKHQSIFSSYQYRNYAQRGKASCLSSHSCSVAVPRQQFRFLLVRCRALLTTAYSSLVLHPGNPPVVELARELSESPVLQELPSQEWAFIIWPHGGYNWQGYQQTRGTEGWNLWLS